MIKIFISHERMNNIMLIVNHERKEYMLILNRDIIDLFRTTIKQYIIEFINYMDLVFYIQKTLKNDYKEIKYEKKI